MAQFLLARTVEVKLNGPRAAEPQAPTAPTAQATARRSAESYFFCVGILESRQASWPADPIVP